jgi:hypothetical protein
MDTIKAQRATVKFYEGVEFDSYLLPDREFRVGKASIAQALGYNKNWTGKLLKKAESLVTSSDEKQGSNPSYLVQNKAQSLVASLDGEIKKIEIDGMVAETLSLKDFRIFIRYADRQGNNLATAILDAIVDVGLEDWFRLSHGIKELTLEEKRDRFYKSYAETINWLEQDKTEVKYLELPGDDNPHWNNATSLIVDYNWRGQPIYA